MGKSKCAVILALVMAVFAFTGCAGAQKGAITLYDSETLYIEREGAETRIFDQAGGTAYTITSHLVRVPADPAAQVGEATTRVETDTIRLQTVHGLIIVTDKTTGKTLYIKRVR